MFQNQPRNQLQETIKIGPYLKTEVTKRRNHQKLKNIIRHQI